VAKGEEPRFRRPVLLCKYRLQICRYSALRRTLSIHTGARDLVIHLVANRPDSSHEQQVSVGGGREFSPLFRPTRATHEVFRDTKRWPGL